MACRRRYLPFAFIFCCNSCHYVCRMVTRTTSAPPAVATGRRMWLITSVVTALGMMRATAAIAAF